MIQDYHNLKKCCDTTYTIKDNKLKIGNLSDNQLDIAKEILERKVKLTDIESKQLNAVDYVINYRSNCALEGLYQEMQSRRIDRANKFVNSLGLWGKKIGETIKTLDDKPFAKEMVTKRSIKRVLTH